MGNTVQLDVRNIMPRERHPKIFDMFDKLKEGESFELVNDHDPKPLYYQFVHERPNQFKWEYQEEGPEVWKVSILKTSNFSKAEVSPQTEVKPKWAASLDSSHEVLLDVRPMIEKGEEPFQAIMKAVKGLGDGQYLRLVNSFEPVPLYAVLGKQGFEIFAETKDGIWNIYFKKPSGKGSVPPAGVKTDSPSDDLFDRMVVRKPRVEVDVRGLMPPEPMIRIFEELNSLPPGGVIFVHHHREPVMLYDKLRERGYEGVTRKLGDSDYKVLIWKKEG